MRKQTKKILSLVMSAAMALSLGAGVDMTKAEAADALVWSGSATFADEWSMETIEVKTDEGSTISFAGMNYNSVGAIIKVDLSAFKNPTIKVTATEGKADGNFAVTSNDWMKLYVGVNDKKDINGKDALIPATQTTIEGKLDPTVTEYNLTAPGRTVTKIEITEGDATETPSEDPATPSAAPSEEPSAAPSEEPKVPTADQLVGTAQLDSQANGWCGNEDCVNVKAEINGPGTYVVSSNWDEVQEDPQAYCAMTCGDLKDIASYITFSDVTVWVDGKVVDMPVIYGGDKDCRIQLWNTWANDGVGAGCEVPENLPETFYEIKVQFTIGLRDTARDWDAEALDATLINVDTTKENYEPERKPEEPTIVDPTPTPVVTKNPAKSVKAAKKSVTVKKGKKANLTFKVTAADNKKVTTDKVSAVSSNKKAVKVTKVTTKAGKVVVSVKAAKKGSAKVTVKVGSKKATTKVKVK